MVRVKAKKTKITDIKKVKEIDEIKNKTNLILESRQNVNHLVDLFSTLNDESTSKSSVELIQRSFSKIFVRFLQTKEMLVDGVNDNESTVKYKKWLQDLYKQSVDHFINALVEAESDASKKLSLDLLMKFLSEEGKYPFLPFDTSLDTFPYNLLERICATLTSDETDMQNLIIEYNNNLIYDDFRYYTLKALHKLIKEQEDKDAVNINVFLNNVFYILSAIKLTSPQELLKRQKKLKEKARLARKRGSGQANIILCLPTEPDHKCFKIDYERDANLFAEVWLSLFAFKLPLSLYRKILIMMDKQIMPHFQNPLKLTDFLIQSYDSGGPLSVLSLSSLYILMMKCNLEYPSFYKKLYSLLEPDILLSKYRSRLLFWTDLFLTSTHISSHIVASFIKRLSRLTLTASPDTILILIPFIGNLFIRHPNLVSMIRSNSSESMDCDPFNNKEADPEKTNAIESSLWEIKTLQNHWFPEVSRMASFINKDLPKREWDLAGLLENNYDDMLQRCINSIKVNENEDIVFDDRLAKECMALMQ